MHPQRLERLNQRPDGASPTELAMALNPVRVEDNSALHHQIKGR